MHFQMAISMLLLLAAKVRCDSDDDAQSVSIADFKATFLSEAIVPDVLAAFNPSVQFYVSYATDDGDAAFLTPGTNLTIPEAKAPFEISVENISNGTGVTDKSRFIIYMIGPDVPSRANPTSRNVRHFLGGNFTVSTVPSALLPTAIILTNLSSATNEYASPAPSPNTGVHRYVYLIYTQPLALNTKGFADLGFNVSKRTGFNLTQFRTLAGLGASIGGTSFLIDTDSTTNDTSPTTASGTSSTTAIGTATGSGTGARPSTVTTSGAMMAAGWSGGAADLMVTFCVVGFGAMLVGFL